jgi:Anti-sigma-K factor rskA
VTDSVQLTCAEVDELAGLYVLDALESDEMDAVRQHLERHPGVHPGLADLGGVVPALFGAIEPIDAPPELRARVLDAVGRAELARAELATVESSRVVEPATRPLAGGTARGAALQPVRPGVRDAPPSSISEHRERRLARRPWQTVLAMAAVVLIVVLGGWNLLLQDRAGSAETRVAVLRDAIAASTDPSSEVALLRGSGPAAGASGLAVFPKGRPGTIVVEGLPPVASGRTYQAWFLANGTPVSAGLMSVGSDGFAVLSGVSPAPATDTIALTVEIARGAPQPTGQPIVLGQIGHPVAGTRLLRRSS